MLIVINIKEFLISRFGVALLSALLIPIVIFIIGSLLGAVQNAIIELLSSVVGIDIALFMVNDISFVGTIHHELSHAVVAFLTGAKITAIELYNPHDKTLGSVSYYARGNIVTRSLQATLGAMAPMFCGYLTIQMLIKFGYPLVVLDWQRWLYWYILLSVFMHMTMSPQDVRVSMKGLPICIIIAFIVLYITRFNFMTYLEEGSMRLFDIFKRLLWESRVL